MKRTVAGEQYFTSTDLARRCIERVAANYDLAGFDQIVEPSAGGGAFFDLLPADTRIGLDIDPRHPELEIADFLEWQPVIPTGRTLTIGNPPFGQRGGMAMKFVAKACEFSDVVAFILPRSFQKYTFSNRVPVTFHLVEAFDCDDFAHPDGTRVRINAVFQIWEKRPEARELIKLPSSHPDFEMRHGHLSRLTPEELTRMRRDFEFAIAQVGSDFRPRPVGEVTRGSQWFIRPLVPGVRERFEHLDFSFLDNMNTAHKSLSKRDIIAAYAAQEGQLPTQLPRFH